MYIPMEDLSLLESKRDSVIMELEERKDTSIEDVVIGVGRFIGQGERPCLYIIYKEDMQAAPLPLSIDEVIDMSAKDIIEDCEV